MLSIQVFQHMHVHIHMFTDASNAIYELAILHNKQHC